MNSVTDHWIVSCCSLFWVSVYGFYHSNYLLLSKFQVHVIAPTKEQNKVAGTNKRQKHWQDIWKESPTIPSLKADGVYADNDMDRANMFNNHFSKCFNTSSPLSVSSEPTEHLDLSEENPENMPPLSDSPHWTPGIAWRKPRKLVMYEGWSYESTSNNS